MRSTSSDGTRRTEIVSGRADDDETDESNIQVDHSDAETSRSPMHVEQNKGMSPAGIRASVAALQPYLSHSVKPKVKEVSILEILPDGTKGFFGIRSTNEFLKFVHENAGSELLNESTGMEPDRSLRPGQGELREIKENDLRCLQNQFHIHEEPVILVRRNAVLFSMNPLRAIITAKNMILIVPVEAESLLSIVYEYMKGIFEDVSTLNSRKNNNSFSTEMRGYKAMLATMTALHIQDYATLSNQVEIELQYLKSSSKITAEVQDSLRALKNSVLSQIIKIDGYRRLLKKIFWNEEDLALMNLTLLAENPLLYKKPLQPEVLNQQDDISILFESYLMDHHAIGTKLNFLQAQIQSSEELVSFRLDMYRNDLLFVEMILIICMLALTVGSFITSSFGMNLTTGIPTDDPYIFWIFSIILTIMLMGLTWFLIARYRLTGSISSAIVKK